jgi:hypothetical protein
LRRRDGCLYHDGRGSDCGVDGADSPVPTVLGRAWCTVEKRRRGSVGAKGGLAVRSARHGVR